MPDSTEPKRSIQMPDGRTMSVPASWSPQQVQAHIDGMRQKVPSFNKMFKGGEQPLGWGDWLAEQAPTIGALAGGGAAALLEIGTLGMGTPAALGLPALGAAGGSLVRDWRRSARKDVRAPETPGQVLGNAVGEGVLEGVTSAVLPVVGKGVAKAAKGFAGHAESMVAKALNPKMRQLMKMPGASRADGPAMKARELGRFLIDHDIAQSQKGFGKLQTLIEGTDTARTNLADKAKAAGKTAFVLADAYDPTKNAALNQWITENISKVSDPSDAVSLLFKTAEKDNVGNLARKAGKQWLPRAVDAPELMEVLKNDARKLGPVWGERPPAEKDLFKAIHRGKRDTLNALVGSRRASVKGFDKLQRKSFEELGKAEHLGIKAREAMTHNITEDMLSESGLPSTFLTYSHPVLAGASMLAKNPALLRRFKSFRGRKLWDPASRLMQKPSALAQQYLDSPLAKLTAESGRRVGVNALGGPPEQQSPEDYAELDALYEAYLRQMQGE